MTRINKAVKEAIKRPVNWEGPLPVTADSHPFSSMAYAREPLDLSAYGYVEEEYLQAGRANVYQDLGQGLALKDQDLDYCTRIMVRKPAQADQFSGRVYLDIYNASNGYDIEDIWRRSYQHILGNGHIYIGISSKPINALSLKNFDYGRYEKINWASRQAAPQPATVNQQMSIPGTEEGLVWDMISQLAWGMRAGQAPFLEGLDLKEVYLTGQSQSAMYLNTYLYYFEDILSQAFDQPLFDGYLSVVGYGVMRSLDQQDDEERMFAVREQAFKPSQVPVLYLSSEGDINLFGTMKPSTIKTETVNPMSRHYELAGSPHTDPASPLIPDNSEIAKTKNPPKILDGEYHYTVNDLQLAYYVNSCMEWLHDWAIEGREAPASQLIDRDAQGQVCRDEYGNAKGGLRSLYVDVPIAHYHANAQADDSQIDQNVGNVNGSMTYFTEEELADRYRDGTDYLEQFKQRLDQALEAKELTAADGERMRSWAQEMAQKLWKDG
ncbi:alpha/beta hydrolase domain-containing protein [Aerococcus sanguinicola]|uniref:alpha/beta hydrolase domain-containing protein n=1 Tax=Aerococcus sanguinicola TaxID=119206 RepID=UPI0018A6F7AE|nr:alpha/beta hydrolase domain-containing protein [Aerococcus sanguinicola]